MLQMHFSSLGHVFAPHKLQEKQVHSQLCMCHGCLHVACRLSSITDYAKAAVAVLQANVFVVGDPDQAIYGWRGANVVNMSRSFTIDYPGEVTKQWACQQAYCA